MNSLNTYHGLDKLEQKLGKLGEEKQALQIQASTMMRTPKFEPSFSSAKLDNWEREIAKLSEREASLLQERQELMSSPAYVKLREDKAAALRAKYNELTKEHEKLRHRLALWHNEADDKLIDGSAEVMKLSGEYLALVEHEKLYATACEQLVSAMRTVARANGA